MNKLKQVLHIMATFTMPQRMGNTFLPTAAAGDPEKAMCMLESFSIETKEALLYQVRRLLQLAQSCQH